MLAWAAAYWQGIAGRSDAVWFRNPTLDSILTIGVLTLTLLLGCIGLISETCFRWVLLADIWLLAHPHLAAMYTRLVFDRQSARQHRFLILGLPPLVLAGTAAAAWFGGALALITAYYLWQTWHYTSQSYGIARAVGGSQARPSGKLTTAVIFAFPIWGLLHRAHQNPSVFYEWPIALPEIPEAVATAAGLGAGGLLLWWIADRARAIHHHHTAGLLTHTLFVLSHVVVTVVSFVAVDEITHGWLFINIWHNAQYIVFVWAYNARRFKGGVDPRAPMLSRLSQPRNALYYLGVCVGAGTLFYLGVRLITNLLAAHFVSVVLIVHLAINFHHYLVDAVIWKRKRANTGVCQYGTR